MLAPLQIKCNKGKKIIMIKREIVQCTICVEVFKQSPDPGSPIYACEYLLMAALECKCGATPRMMGT